MLCVSFIFCNEINILLANVLNTNEQHIFMRCVICGPPALRQFKIKSRLPGLQLFQVVSTFSTHRDGDPQWLSLPRFAWGSEVVSIRTGRCPQMAGTWKSTGPPPCNSAIIVSPVIWWAFGTLWQLNIALENHHFQWGSNIWPFSIAVVNYQRVNPPFLNLASRSSTAHWGKVTNAPLKKVGVPQKSAG